MEQSKIIDTLETYHVFGEGLAGWPEKGLAVACCRPGKDLAGGLVDFLGKDLTKDRRLLVPI